MDNTQLVDCIKWADNSISWIWRNTNSKETRKQGNWGGVYDNKECTFAWKKQVTITSKRQFTIPQKFFTELGFDRSAVCYVSDGKLIIEPVTPISGGEFAEQILKELIDEGYNGNELLSEFRIRQAKVRPAVEAMLEDAKNAALGIGEYETYDDVFGSEEWTWRYYAYFPLQLSI